MQIIRFEDTYGMFELYLMMHRITHSELNWINDSVCYCDRIKTYFSRGIGCSGLARLHSDELYAYRAAGLQHMDRIITVVDLDGENNNGQSTLRHITCASNIQKLESRARKFGFNGQFLFVPTIFASETVMLYQHLRQSTKKFVIEDIVHNIDTWRFHLIMVAILNELAYARDAKHTEKYDNIERLEISFKNALALGCTRNIPIIEFMLNNNYYGITEAEMCRLVAYEENAFNFRKNNIIEFNLCGVKVDNHTKLLAIKDKFGNFPKLG